jgi:hypothetical protein
MAGVPGVIGEHRIGASRDRPEVRYLRPVPGYFVGSIRCSYVVPGNITYG